ncbi:hypothetical protein, partial [Ralstonia solanacearum]
EMRGQIHFVSWRSCLAMVKHADRKHALLVMALWRRELALERGDVQRVAELGGEVLFTLETLGGLMGVW